MLKGNGYCITKSNIFRHELIGLEVRIVECNDVGLKNVVGVVVDETKNTFKLDVGNGKEIVVPKPGKVFLFRIGDEEVIVRGSDICFAPERRLKLRGAL